MRGARAVVALLLSWGACNVHAKPKAQLKFENVPQRVEVGGTFDVHVVGPAGSTENVTLKVAPSSQGNGTVTGAITGELDGGDPYSTVTFQDVAISRTGLYMLMADGPALSGLSSSIQAVPSLQCNNQPWDQKLTCGDCVSIWNFDCVYCPQLEACLPGGIRGADERSTCSEFYLHVCWIRGDFATFIFPGAALIIAFFAAAYCVFVACGRSRESSRRTMEDYDNRFSLAHKRASAKQYGATEQGENNARSRKSEDLRRKMEAKYATTGGAARIQLESRE